MKRSFKLLLWIFVIVWSILTGILIVTQGKGAWAKELDQKPTPMPIFTPTPTPTDTQSPSYLPFAWKNFVSYIAVPRIIHVSAIDADTQDPISDTVIYAFDGYKYDAHTIYFGCWADKCNGCYLVDGECDIVVNDDLWAGMRDVWVFGTTINLEMFEPWISSTILNDTGVVNYETRAYFFEDQRTLNPSSNMIMEIRK